MPVFPEFKPIEISDRAIIYKSLMEYQPQTSELSFTNLFIWRRHYGVIWSQYDGCLIFIFDKTGYGIQPICPIPKPEMVKLLLGYLKNKYGNGTSLQRVESRFIENLKEKTGLKFEPTPEHFDYVYKSEDLINLAGRKYHSKRNYINTFHASYQWEYSDMTEEHVPGCLEMAARWCDRRSCEEDVNLSLSGEFEAITDALNNFKILGVKGGVIKINGKIEAFTLGEMLNNETAVIHIEKADPDIRGLYTVINQQFCEHNWTNVPFINREQDLGEPQLRQAKESYYPDHMVQKNSIKLAA